MTAFESSTHSIHTTYLAKLILTLHDQIFSIRRPFIARHAFTVHESSQIHIICVMRMYSDLSELHLMFSITH